jgi:hypothetical protein
VQASGGNRAGAGRRRFICHCCGDPVEHLREHGFDLRAVRRECGIGLAMAGDAYA